MNLKDHNKQYRLGLDSKIVIKESATFKITPKYTPAERLIEAAVEHKPLLSKLKSQDLAKHEGKKPPSGAGIINTNKIKLENEKLKEKILKRPLSKTSNRYDRKSYVKDTVSQNSTNRY